MAAMGTGKGQFYGKKSGYHHIRWKRGFKKTPFSIVYPFEVTGFYLGAILILELDGSLVVGILSCNDAPHARNVQ